MKTLIIALALTLGLAAAAQACTNFNRLKDFNPRRHVSGLPDFGSSADKLAYVVVRHPAGILRFSFYAERGALGTYTASGTGEALPVSVGISENLCKSGSTNLMNRKVHTRLQMPETYALKSPVSHPANEAAAQALAARVLAETYCRGGQIERKFGRQRVDPNRGNPVVRTVPQIQSFPKDERTAWVVQLSCSLWRKAG